MTTSELVASSIEALIEKYKHEITRDGDWWWGNDSVDINIHCPNDDGVYHINIYPFDTVKGLPNYEVCITLPPVFLGE